MMNANKWKSIERLGGKNETEFIFERSDMLRNRQIMIKPMFPDKPELCRVEFELK